MRVMFVVQRYQGETTETTTAASLIVGSFGYSDPRKNVACHKHAPKMPASVPLNASCRMPKRRKPNGTIASLTARKALFRALEDVSFMPSCKAFKRAVVAQKVFNKAYLLI